MRSRRSCFVLFITCVAAAVTSHAVAGLNRWTSTGPQGGNASSIAVDRRSEGVVYAVVNGIIHKSEDAGEHWRSANEGVSASVFSMTVSPADPLVLYAAGFAGSTELFKSTDAGKSWMGIPAPNQLHGIARLAVSGDALVVASDTTVDRTTDDGLSWQRTFTSIIGGQTMCCISRLLTHPDGSLLLIHRTAYRSTDGGISWRALRSSPGDLVTGAIDTDGTIFVETADLMTRIMHRSRDSGETWSEVVRLGAPVRSIDAVSGRLYIFRGCDPEALGDVRFCKNGLVEYDGVQLIEHRGFAGAAVRSVVSAGPMRLLATTDGAGILTTTEGDPEWTTVNAGLPGAWGNDIAVAPHHASVVYAATGAGLIKSDDSGTTWRTIGDAGWQAISVSPVERDVAYVATVDGIKKTIDGGTSFSVVQPKVAATVTVAPSNANMIYAALIDGMATSTDAGQNWTTSNDGIEFFNRDSGFGFFINGPIVVDPYDENTAYVARDEALYKTTTAGVRWVRLLTSRMSGDGFADFWGHTVVVDPSDSKTLYVTGGRNGGVVSHDGGTTWAPASFPDTVRQLVFDPAAPNVVYAIHNNGALSQSNDRGVTFSAFADGLEGIWVYRLGIDASGHFLYAATSQGIYSFDRSSRKRRRSAGR